MCIYDRFIMKLGLLRFVYRGILTGMPLFTYNPITKTPIHVPFTISPHSTYINYELSPSQTHVLGMHSLIPREQQNMVELVFTSEKDTEETIKI